MYPILFSLGPVRIFSYSIFLLLSWVVFSFIFWRLLRSAAVEEEKIFDLTFYSTVWGLVFARIGYVVTHLALFGDGLLKILALWVAPGLSLYGGLFGAVATLVALSKRSKVRLGLILDAWALAFPAALILAELGSLLDGAEVGLVTTFPWGIRYVGSLGARHPVQVYTILFLSFLVAFTAMLLRRSEKEKWPYGVVGIWFFLLFSTGMFCIEFFKESSVYLLTLTSNQWVLLAFLAETLGSVYVRGGGREAIIALRNRLRGGLRVSSVNKRT